MVVRAIDDHQVGATTIMLTSGVGRSILPLRHASPRSVETIDRTR
jgi:hypothetical protein